MNIGTGQVNKKIEEEVSKIFNCSAGSGGISKCKTIYDELLHCNYNIEVWQLAHLEKMFEAKPELFTNPDSQEEWINVLDEVIKQEQEILQKLDEK
ncbi:MAG: hypothetical protein I3270_00310 [Candidatus Moeniiplasma glomeromycotorum]|nr:hypothetical protein [Candidatus Moeniiplasma glomeromycotorum]MCE8162262.1 hypothetical protein [Candidatus Moeniiplasma glomeromycotorum]MCE8166082.1 hypothetical protein [Candidatus Moeniiplasma glomeromycotorum]MCE8166661.1 hypothetical protein [Candidatus Moeniiplasma glomeromycotorum]